MRRLAGLLLLLGCAAWSFGEQPTGSTGSTGSFPLIFFGKVLLADPTRLELRLVGTFSPAAPAVAADPQGRIWGRLEPRHLAALEPDGGEMVARVALPHKPLGLLIAADGKAYVTHNSLTKEGFTLSVVDTRVPALLRELPGIAGLSTDLAVAAGFLYLAAEGVRKEDNRNSYLYQIDGASGLVREALRYEDAGVFWKLAADGERLYLGYLPTRDDPRFGRVELRDARSGALRRSWDRVPGPLRGLYAAGRKVLLFCGRADGNTELLVLDPLLEAVSQQRTLQGSVGRVLGLHGSLLVYQDKPFEAGSRKVKVCFYELEEGRELRRIDIRDHLLAGTERGERLR